jgi:hypothetical protein
MVTENSAQALRTDHIVGGVQDYAFLFSGSIVKDRMSFANPTDGKGIIPLPQTQENSHKRIAETIHGYREVGFYGGIPFEKLTKILVKTDDMSPQNIAKIKQQTIAIIKSAGGESNLVSKTGKSLDDLIEVINDNTRRHTLLALSKSDT